MSQSPPPRSARIQTQLLIRPARRNGPRECYYPGSEGEPRARMLAPKPRAGVWTLFYNLSNASPASFSIGIPDARDNFSASTRRSTLHSLIHR